MSRRLGAQEVTLGTLVNIPPSDSHAEKEPPYQRSVVELVICGDGESYCMKYMRLLELWETGEWRSRCLTLKVGVEANSEDINAVCRPAGRRNGDTFEIDHDWKYATKLWKFGCCF
jgi:hypothetical protein